MVNVTVSVPDGLKRRMDVLGRDVNWSEVFRQCVEARLQERAEDKKGEAISRLEEMLIPEHAKKEAEIKSKGNAETERFSKRWGRPDHRSPESDWVRSGGVYLSKSVDLRLGAGKLKKIDIKNKKAEPQLDTEIGRGLWDDDTMNVADAFRKLGFHVGEREFLTDDVWLYLFPDATTGEGRELARRTLERNRAYGLLAQDSEDEIFLGYREERRR